MIAYKFLAAGAVGRFSDFRWPVPSGGEPGAWVGGAALEQCRTGIHACTLGQLLDWIDDELWTIELAGDVVVRETMVVAERGRLCERVTAWDADAARAFADSCAWRARDFAIRALRRVGLTEVAEELVDAIELARVQAVSAKATATVDERTAELTGFAADAVALAEGRRPEMWGADEPKLVRVAEQTPGAVAANLGYVTAHAAGRDAVAAAGSEDAYPDGVAAERAWQLGWLSERCGLGAPG